VDNLIRVLVIDDHTVERMGLSALLNAVPDFTVVGEAANGIEALFMARESQPDIILVDQRVFHKEGLGTIWRIWQQNPNVTVLILCQSSEGMRAAADFDSGRLCFTRKDSATDDLAGVIREVLKRAA
jgi:NarL family two-component system response regulator LiaR